MSSVATNLDRPPRTDGPQVGAATRSVIVLGAGGNIASHLVPLLGRIESIGTVTLIDRDVYEPENLDGQAITPMDVGKPKALVQARRLRRIRPSLLVRPIPEPLENLPLGSFRADLILACLDSREARRRVNEIAFRLGIPWIDSGVEAGGLLARVNAYDPRVPTTPCLECGWGAADYDALEQAYPCAGGKGDEPPATRAPASLGSLCASLQAIECGKWLCARPDRLAAGREVMIDASSHAHYVTDLRRSDDCRFDHRVWRIERLGQGPTELTLAAALALPARSDGAEEPEPSTTSLSVEGQRFVTRLTCTGCGRSRSLARLHASFRADDGVCHGCGRVCLPTGFDLSDRIDALRLPAGAASRSLRRIGLRKGEVFSLTHAGDESHYELGGLAS